MERYQVATRQFLNEFDYYWEQMLHLLGNQQSQLVAGSRLRPQICLWGYLSTLLPEQIMSHSYSQIANVAVSIEMIHKASLLIDDWIDEDQERHGHPAFHTEHTPQYTVLFALNMIGLSMSRLEGIFSESLVLPQHYSLCLNTLISTIYSMAQGALKELQLQDNDFFCTEKIKEIAQLETSDIISNSFLLGYYVGVGEKRNPNIETIFKEIGDQCGYLFQALNDLEVFCNPEKLRRHKGTLNMDYNMNRKNLAISKLFSVANSRDRILLRQANDVMIWNLIKKYKIIETFTKELENVYCNILLTSDKLQAFDLPSEWQQGLKWFLNYVKKFANERLKG